MSNLMESRIEVICPQCLSLFTKWRSSKQTYCSRYCSDQNVRGTHELSGTPEHRQWKAMRWRCSERNPQRHRYFDRGIRVCDRWDSFENFLDDMGKRPHPRATIDRIDNDLGYSPTNCRWATYKQQANNTSRTNYIVHNGKRLNLTDLHETTGIHNETLRRRIKNGWSYEQIIATPTNPSKRQRNLYGQFV